MPVLDRTLGRFSTFGYGKKQVPPIPPAGDYYNAVTQGGLDNTGATSVTSGIGTCITAYKNGGYDGLYFPAGTYLLSTTLTVPSSTVLVGSGMTTAWLKGQVVFGSTSAFTDMKMGDTGAQAFSPTSGANYTTASNCAFVGGHATTDGLVNFKVPCHHITLTDCNIGSGPVNGMTLYDGGVGGTLHDILFDGCTWESSARMSFECLGRGSAGIYQDINMNNCLFKPAGDQAISYDGGGFATNCALTDVTIQGAGNQAGASYGNALEFNGPSGFTVTRMTVYRVRNHMLNANRHSVAGCGWTFTDCVFDYTTKLQTVDTVNGYVLALNTAGDAAHSVNYATFTGCTINAADKANNTAYFNYSSYNTFTNCTWEGSGSRRLAYETNGATGNTGLPT